MSAKTVRKKEFDSYSTASGFSKHSGERNRPHGGKTPRFSLRSLFYRRHPSRKSIRSINSNTELEARSVSSFQASQSERDTSSVITGGSTTPFTDRDHDAASSGRRSALTISSKDTTECPLCLTHQPRDNFPPIMTCHHRSCRECLRQYLRIEISESRVNIACPECAERFHPNDIREILADDRLMNKYEEFMLRRILVADPDARWCPAPDCGYAVIATGCASCPKLKCERVGCDTSFCYHCKQYWHPNQTCDAARAERSSNIRSSSLSYSHDSTSHSEIKPCPRCGAFIIKLDDGSCNHMTCAVCGAEFCWLCMKEISDLHYLSPSGCTFWGKKPWSRKKKILWQLGTLVGAPVGIGLVAGVAVPAMIIGIPVWVGRKLHTKYEHAPKYKRNLIITGGVTGAILVSPVLAGLAVSIGVPILLAYVYGVVPISLCRSGGCGVTTTDSGGVRFEFEEDNETQAGVSGPYNPAGDAQSVETQSPHVANPSLAPSIGEMSMGLTNSLSASGSHMDRVGAIRDECDHESASNRAIAGVSLNGSLSGSATAGPSGFQHRMEVQAELSAAQSTVHSKRASLSSESANFSIDAKSATVSFCDDASTKGLAGSICTRDKDNVSAIIPPLEVHMDMANSTVHYQHNTEGGHSSEMNTHKAHGSPTSSRSVNFCGEEVIGHGCHHSTAGKKFKRQSLSVGDSIYEHTETARKVPSGCSVHSLCEVQAGSASHCAEASNGSGYLSVSHISPCVSCRSSPTCTSIDELQGSPRSESGAVGLTEIESDRPLEYRLKRDSTSTDSTSVETVSVLETGTLKPYHLSSSSADAYGASSSRSEEYPSRMAYPERHHRTFYPRVSFEADGCAESHSTSCSSSASSSQALCQRLDSETDDGSTTSS